MIGFKKWLTASLTVAVLASVSLAADTVAAGKIKSIDAESKSFVLTDYAGKDYTFKIGEKLIVNRAGEEVKNDLKTGDAVSVCYDKGLLNWTTHYILVQDGKHKNCELVRGTVKGYDAGKKELTFTTEDKKDCTYTMGKATVRFNREEAPIDDVKIGDHALLIVETVEGKKTLHGVMLDRAKK